MKDKKTKIKSAKSLTKTERLNRLNDSFRAKRANAQKDFEIVCKKLDKNVFPTPLCAELRDEKTGNLLYTTLCSLISLRLRYKKNCNSDSAIVSIAKKLDLYPKKELNEKATTEEELNVLRNKTKKTFKKFARKLKIERKKAPAVSYAQLVFQSNEKTFGLKPLSNRKAQTRKPKVLLYFSAAK